MNLDSFFAPKSVAIVGASSDEGKAGHQILYNMKRLGFSGQVYPVNPNETEILGYRCYPSLLDIPSEVELMVVVVPAPAVPDVFRHAACRGDVRAAVIVAAGFSETGIPERVELEKHIVEIARNSGIRVIGPNCVGIMNERAKLDTTFAPNINQVPGGMSVITQSGSLGASILMFAGDQPVPIGFNKWAHVGNMSDVDLLEILKYYKHDPETRAIAVYMEGIDNAREFVDTAKTVARDKPIIVLKVGRTELGSNAAASHTGSLAGADAVYDGAFIQSGIVRVRNIEELLDTAKAFSMQPLPAGDRICILTEAGGPGIIAMDDLGEAGTTRLADLAPETVATLREILPPMAIVNRPKGYVDMSAAANEIQHAQALDVVLADPGVDGVILLTVPPTFLRPEELGTRVGEVARKHKKPVLACLLAGNWVKQARQTLETAGVPTFDMPERAARAMSNMVKRFHLLKGLTGPTSPGYCVDASDLIARARKDGSQELVARELLMRYQIECDDYRFVRTEKEALESAESLGYPLVVKVVSPQVIHKSDVGGVKLNIKSAQELTGCIRKMGIDVQQKVPGATILGYLLAQQAPEGVEVIIGATHDAQMGPVVMFGLGGTLVELYKDVVFRLAPVRIDEAMHMIESVKGAALFKGYRGARPCDVNALADLIVKVSHLIAEQPDVKDIELNPVRLYATGYKVLDARVII